MRPVTGKIIRMLTARLVDEDKGKLKRSTLSKEMQDRSSLSNSRTSLVIPDLKIVDKEIEMHLTKLLQHLGQHLGKKNYFGDPTRVSIDDLMYYNDILTI